MAVCRQCNSPAGRGDAFCAVCGAALPPPAPVAHDGRGFWGSLFDLSFQDFITPRIVRILFVAGMVLYGLLAFTYLVFAASMSRFLSGGAMVGLFLGAAVGFVVAVVMLRVGLELIIVFFNMASDLKALRRRDEEGREDRCPS